MTEKQNMFYVREVYIIKFEYDHILKTDLIINVSKLLFVFK